jgi:hypothetical protein
MTSQAARLREHHEHVKVEFLQTMTSPVMHLDRYSLIQQPSQGGAIHFHHPAII